MNHIEGNEENEWKIPLENWVHKHIHQLLQHDKNSILLPATSSLLGVYISLQHGQYNNMLDFLCLSILINNTLILMIIQSNNEKERKKDTGSNGHISQK